MLKIPHDDRNRNGALDACEDLNGDGFIGPALLEVNTKPYIGATQVVQILEVKMLR